MEAIPSGDDAHRLPPAPACGYGTRNATSCRRPPLAGGGGRCSRHAGLPSTQAERDAAKRAALRHGYYLSGFLDETEREMFERICEGEVDPEELCRQTAAALYIRAMRMTFWESEDGEASPLTTQAFAELRQTLEARGFGAINAKRIARQREASLGGVDA
ncbi:MAG: hypothetical protein LC624_06245 [Halobacteriales archaeon]|nr:hypothetical protein [Halobacteriales archaeon]